VVAASSLEGQVVLKKTNIPTYGSRSSWRPRNQEDFGDGGAYPECPVAQYPLDMGKKKVTSGGALVLKSDSSIAETIARQGHNDARIVHTSFKDLIPLRARADAGEIELSRPSEEEVEATKKRTEEALQALVSSASAAQKPKTIKKSNDEPTYVRYTPHQVSYSSTSVWKTANPVQGQMGKQNSGQDRIIKIVNRQQDPLAPAMFKHKKIPRGPPSPPAPVMHSPPRKVTREEAEQWRIPPSVSNWKNHKGYTIALDKRLAANGRGLEDNTINSKFADFSEALYTADRLAREEVKQRAQMQQKLNEREEERKAEHLRQLAQRAREERTAATTSRRSRSRSRSQSRSQSRDRRRDRSASYSSRSSSASDSEEERVRERARARKERQRENQRELRQQHMGAERRVQMMAREAGRDISEKIALGLAKPTTSGEAMYDSRLFNQSSGFAAGFNEDQMYDKPLFQAQDALATLYKPGANAQDEGEDEGETYEKITKTKRFEGFSGGAGGEEREGPVQFERDIQRGGAAGGKEDDPFQIGQMISDVTGGKAGGKKRFGLQDEEEAEGRGAKRARVESDED
jgi:SNW domain-containing protein 1